MMVTAQTPTNVVVIKYCLIFLSLIVLASSLIPITSVLPLPSPSVQALAMIVCGSTARHGQCKREVGNQGGSPRTNAAIPTAILAGIGRLKKKAAMNHVLISLAKSPLNKHLTKPSNPLPFSFLFLIFYLSQKGFYFCIFYNAIYVSVNKSYRNWN